MSGEQSIQESPTSGLLKKAKRRSIRATLSTPSKGFDTNFAIAPSAAAVNDVSRKLVNPEAAPQVEKVLHTILQAEDLAHALYMDEKKRCEANPEERQPIPNRKVCTYEDNGRATEVEYKISRVDTPAGLNAFILEPEDGVSEIKVVFVGTKDLPGVVRDMEDEAAGQQSFEQHKDKVLAKLNEAVGNIEGDSVKINVIGHSLGGADAQRLVQNIVQVKANPEMNGPNEVYGQMVSPFAHPITYPIADCANLMKKKVHLELNTSAAPMLSKEKGKQFATDLKKATKEGDLSLKATACVYKLDVVPTFGEQHLLAQRGAELCLWSELLSSGQEPQAGKIYLSALPDGRLEFLMKGENEQFEIGILQDITVKGPLTNDLLMMKRAEILEAASEQGLTTCDVMSLCEEATVAHVKAKPFQHESTIFTKVGELAKEGIEILHTKKNDKPSAEKTRKEAKMANVLNRSSGIDRWSFIKYIKEAIKELAIKLREDVAQIYTESPSYQMRSSLR